MDTFKALESYYNTHDENLRLSSRHGSIEFLTTVEYIKKYLKSGMKILEIGAGTGQYSHYFARLGYEVDAVELMPCNIEVFKNNTEPSEKVTITQANATDLSDFSSGTYDITLLLGPMYHLFKQDDKISALSEAIRVTKKGGIIFSAYCSADASILQFGFIKGNANYLIDSGMLDPVTFKTHSEPKDIFELYTKTDIDSLMENFEVKRLHFVGTDMAAHYFPDIIDNMDNKTFQLYFRYHMSICERYDLVGASNHFLDIFKVI